MSCKFSALSIKSALLASQNIYEQKNKNLVPILVVTLEVTKCDWGRSKK